MAVLSNFYRWLSCSFCHRLLFCYVAGLVALSFVISAEIQLCLSPGIKYFLQFLFGYFCVCIRLLFLTILCDTWKLLIQMVDSVLIVQKMVFVLTRGWLMGALSVVDANFYCHLLKRTKTIIVFTNSYIILWVWQIFFPSIWCEFVQKTFIIVDINSNIVCASAVGFNSMSVWIVGNFLWDFTYCCFRSHECSRILCYIMFDRIDHC